MHDQKIRDQIILEQDHLQSVQDHLARFIHVTTLLLDQNGDPLTRASNLHSYCRNRTGSEQRVCDEIHQFLCLQARTAGRPVTGRCPHSGLTSAAVPILLDGRFLGAWIVGQVHLTDGPEACATAHRENSADVDEASDGFPKLSVSEFDAILDFFEALAEQMVRIIDVNLLVQDQNERLTALAEEHRRSTEALQAFVDSADAARCVCDRERCSLIVCNRPFAELFDEQPDALTGRRLPDLFDAPPRCGWCPPSPPANLQLVHSAEVVHAGRHLHCSSRSATWLDGRTVQLCNFHDISEHRCMEQRLNELAFHDRVLMIPNTLCMEMELRKNPVYDAMIALDVADLRKINDLYGREFGDALLVALRDYILGLDIPRSRLYSLDIANFALLLESGERSCSAQEIAQQLQDRFQERWTLSTDGGMQEVLIQANLCVLPLSGISGSVRLYGAIEHTLDIARATSCVAVYDDNVQKQYERNLHIELGLKRALHTGMQGFSLAFQPIVNPAAGVWQGMEALCRWSDEELGPVSPVEFITIAETSGLIGQVGLWVLDEAVRQAKAWGLDEVKDFLLEVNLSPIQLANPELDRLVMELLQRHGYPPHKLCLEVTESSELNFSGHTLRAVERLSEVGVVIALDDFGTGYASPYALHKLPVKILKTSRSLIGEMEGDSFLQRLFLVMVELAHGSGMEIVAEGIETEPQARMLRQQGADYFQGFLYSKPLTAKQIEVRLLLFQTPSAELASMGASPPPRGEAGSPTLPPRLQDHLNRCVHSLLVEEDSMACFTQILAWTGELLHADHALILLEQGGLLAPLCAWHALHSTPCPRDLREPDIPQPFSEWYSALTQGAVQLDSRCELPDAQQKLLAPFGLDALLAVPLRLGSVLCGALMVGDRRMRRWNEGEIVLLHRLADALGAALQRLRRQQATEKAAIHMERVLDNMDALIYITDLESNEILFVNRRLRQRYGGDVLTGRTCWEALQHRSARCDFCPLPQVFSRPERSVQWENYNPALGIYLRMKDSIIPWSDNRLVHMQCAENITELKKYQLRLEDFSSTDALTSTLNRSAFLISAQKLLARADHDESPVTLALLHIDGLKKENDTRGYTAGDELIRRVVRALRANIRSSDLIGRYGGDEFVVAFAGCELESARARMDIALQILSEQSTSPSSFSYGLVENREVPFSPQPIYLEKLLNIADLRMLEHKRNQRSRPLFSRQAQYLS